MLVEFYAPWCSFCKALAPQYGIASAYLAYLKINAVIAKVDADSTAGGRALAARFNVTGYPTLIWFVNGKPQPYDGLQTDGSDIVFWVVSQTDVNTRALTEQVFTLVEPPHCDCRVIDAGSRLLCFVLFAARQRESAACSFLTLNLTCPLYAFRTSTQLFKGTSTCW